MLREITDIDKGNGCDILLVMYRFMLIYSIFLEMCCNDK